MCIIRYELHQLAAPLNVAQVNLFFPQCRSHRVDNLHRSYDGCNFNSFMCNKYVDTSTKLICALNLCIYISSAVRPSMYLHVVSG